MLHMEEGDITDIIKFYSDGYSIDVLRKEYKVSFNKIRDLLVSHGIKIRTRTEALQKYVAYRECVICNRIFRVKSKWNAKGSRYRKTCSSECESKFRSIAVKGSWKEERKKHMSKLFTGRDTSNWNIARRENKPNWKGGYTSSVYNDIAFTELGLDPVCNECGSTKFICVHHIDKDRTHNTIDNLVVLCKSCHTRLHNKLKDVGVNCPNGFNNKEKS